MCAKMTRERAEEFGAAWNSGNADLVTSFFADDGVYHASVGPDHLGKSYFGKENIRRGVQAFFDRFPDGKFENLKVVVADDVGTFEWDFVATAPDGLRTAGCDLLRFFERQIILKAARPRIGPWPKIPSEIKWLGRERSSARRRSS
jgi:ketosteroid isomerase-like protein